MQQRALASNKLQRELPLLGCITAHMMDLPAGHVAQQPTFQAALRLSINRSRVAYDNGTLADLIGIDRSSFQCMLNADQSDRYRAFPPEKLYLLEREIGNNGPSQWLEMCKKGLLDCQKSVDDKEAELLEQLAALRAKRA